jgi:hypothetical protein
VKNCLEQEQKFFKAYEKMMTTHVTSYYKEEEELKEEMKEEFMKLCMSKLISEFGRREYEANESQIRSSIEEKFNSSIENEAFQNRCLPKTNKEEFIKQKAREMYESRLINIEVQQESGVVTKLTRIPDFTPLQILNTIIFNRTGLAPCMQQLMFNSKPVTKSLDDQGITNNSRIFMLRRVGGG